MFMDRIGSDEYQLNDIEQKISSLIRLKFNLSEIKNLLALSSQNLTNIRSGINKSCLATIVPKDWTLILKIFE